MNEPEEKKAPEDPGLLHVYGQASYHDEAYLVGNTRGLMALREAIDRVLGTEEVQSSAWVSVSDGEGYDMMIMRVDDPWGLKYEYDGNGEIKAWYADGPEGSRWNRIAYPYTDEDWGRESRKDALWPSRFWKYPYIMPPLTVTVAKYLGEKAADAPLVDEGVSIDCPRCGKTHPSWVVAGKDGERLMLYRCPETRGENELIAGFSDGDRFRLVAKLLAADD
jgi:hypothetical protein